MRPPCFPQTNTTRPHWGDETFSFEIPAGQTEGPGRYVTITVFNKGAYSKDECIGMVRSPRMPCPVLLRCISARLFFNCVPFDCGVCSNVSTVGRAERQTSQRRRRKSTRPVVPPVPLEGRQEGGGKPLDPPAGQDRRTRRAMNPLPRKHHRPIFFGLTEEIYFLS